MTATTTTHKPLRVAIIGGGIAGAALAVGLSAAHVQGHVQVRLYEQTSSLQELGFAVAFARSARRALALLDPRVAATLNLPVEGDPAAALGFMKFVDGNDSDQDPQELGTNNSPLGQWANRRTAVLEGLLSLVPEGVVCSNKKLIKLDDASDDKPNVLYFAGGEIVEADVGKSIISLFVFKSMLTLLQSSAVTASILVSAPMSSQKIALPLNTLRASLILSFTELSSLSTTKP